MNNKIMAYNSPTFVHNATDMLIIVCAMWM